MDRSTGSSGSQRQSPQDTNDVAVVVQDKDGMMRVVYIPQRYASSMDPTYINQYIADRFPGYMYVPATEDGGELYASPTAHEGSYSGQMSWLNDQVQANNAPIEQSNAIRDATQTYDDPMGQLGMPSMNASPDMVVAKDPVTGNPVTDAGWRSMRDSANRTLNSPGVDEEGNVIPGSPLPQSDAYGNPVDPYDSLGIQGPVNMSPDELARANKTNLPDFGNSDNPNPPNPPGPSNQPYNLTHDNVELHSIFNKGGTNDDIARYYMNNNNLDGSMAGDFAMNNWDYYDDLWALHNPGVAMPDQLGQYENAAEFMNAMSGPIGTDGIGVMDGYSLWDSQFSDEYMNSERGMGSGENFDEISASQYNQIMTNIQAMTPSMGSQNAGMIMNMVDRSYDDYRQLQLTGNSVNGVSFLQYLKSIGAEDWF